MPSTVHFTRGSEADFSPTSLQFFRLYLPLLAGCLSGVPMRPEDIEELMNGMNRERIEYVVSNEGEDVRANELLRKMR